MNKINRGWKIFLCLILVLFLAVGVYYLWINYQVKQKPSGFMYPPTGKEVVCNQLMALVNKSVSLPVMSQYVSSYHGSIIDKSPLFNGYLIHIPGKCNAQTTENGVAYFKAKPGVLSVGPELAPVEP